MIKVWSLVQFFLDPLDDCGDGSTIDDGLLLWQELHPFPVPGDGLLLYHAVVLVHHQPSV